MQLGDANIGIIEAIAEMISRWNNLALGGTRRAFSACITNPDMFSRMTQCLSRCGKHWRNR